MTSGCTQHPDMLLYKSKIVIVPMTILG